MYKKYVKHQSYKIIYAFEMLQCKCIYGTSTSSNSLCKYQPGLIKICTSVRHRFAYLTARFTAVSKRNVHWVALKHRLNTWTLTHFYYIDIGTNCCVFITLLQKRIAAVQNSNIRGLSLKVNALSCPTPIPSLNLPDSVNKCKTDIKTYLLM